MRTEHYKIKTIRMSEKTYQKLKDKRKRSGLSWNLFIVKLLENTK
jgi:predicted DNA binding CopG/RHH family protein